MIRVWCPETNPTWQHPLITTALKHPDMQFGWGLSGDGADVTFSHSIALMFDIQPIVFHLEESRSLFRYMGKLAPPHDVTPDAAMIAEVQARLLRYERIVTHMDMTMETMAEMFPAIADRLRFCQLGIAEQEPRPKAEKLRFLFTSSFHNIMTEDPHIRFRRGGREVLAAFQMLQSYAGDSIELVMHLPHATSLEPPPGVTVIREVLSNEQIDDLFASAHVYLLPSYDLHSHSVLKAQSHGCIPLVSDAPGYSEIVKHRETGIICAGRSSHECWRGDFGDVLSLNEPAPVRAEYVEALAAWMLELIDGRESLPMWGEAIRRRVRKERPLARWQADICGQIMEVVRGPVAPADAVAA